MNGPNLKPMLKRILPSRIQSAALVIIDEAVALREFLIDGWRYQRVSGRRDSNALRNKSGDNLEAQVTKDYHRVEKGLALRNPKRPFGSSVQNRLTALLTASEDEPYATHARNAVAALDRWNQEGEIDDQVSPFPGASLELPSAEALYNLFRSRRSVRDFDAGRAVPQGILRQAVLLASETPSVCNRQTARVHFYSGGSQVDKILRHQNGNAGFRTSIPVVAVVTVRRGMFLGPSERNQRWIDGGLFAMSLVWALHGLGVSTCMLNWSMNNAHTDALRTSAEIDDSEDVIVLIAIGYPRLGHRVARSPRRELDSLVTFDGPSQERK